MIKNEQDLTLYLCARIAKLENRYFDFKKVGNKDAMLAIKIRIDELESLKRDLKKEEQ